MVIKMKIKKVLVALLVAVFSVFLCAAGSAPLPGPTQGDDLSLEMGRNENIINISGTVSRVAKASDDSGKDMLSVADQLSLLSSEGNAYFERAEYDDVIMRFPGRILPQFVKYVNIIFPEESADGYASYIDSLLFEAITDAHGSMRIDAYSVKDGRWTRRSSAEMETALNDTAPLALQFDLQGDERVRFEAFFNISEDSSTYIKKDLEKSHIVVVDLGGDRGGYITVTNAYFIAGITIVAVILLIAVISERRRKKKKQAK